MDDILPACHTGECLIPKLSEEGDRILRIRTMLVQLSELTGPEVILASFGGLDRYDLELMAVAESEIKKLNEVTNGRNQSEDYR